MIDLTGVDIIGWAWKLFGMLIFFEPHVQSYTNTLLELHTQGRIQQEQHNQELLTDGKARCNWRHYLQLVRRCISIFTTAIVFWLLPGIFVYFLGYQLLYKLIGTSVVSHLSPDSFDMIWFVAKNFVRVVLGLFIIQLVGLVDISHPLRTYTFWRSHIKDGTIERPILEQYIERNPNGFISYLLTWVLILTNTWRSTWGYGLSVVIYCWVLFPLSNPLVSMIEGFFLGLIVWRVCRRYMPTTGSVKVQWIGLVLSRMMGILLLILGMIYVR